ncbi:hypothetical protein G4B88_008252 [Cannabis sativa]|uniref:Uncharacterized protein n=1 Tax=Cannabis sativa TaxID=3483 RepID=A0A7J6FLM5_CANSA|nr:hypothetical protein G4B88_008252 [Cannabis sativa]
MVPLDEASWIPLSPCLSRFDSSTILSIPTVVSSSFWSFFIVVGCLMSSDIVHSIAVDDVSIEPKSILIRSHNSQHDIDKIFGFMIIFSLGLNMLINDPLKEFIKHILNNLHSLCQALQVKWSKERNVISQVRSGTQVHQLFDNFIKTLRIELFIRVLLPKHRPTTHIGITCCNLGAQINCHTISSSILCELNKMTNLFSSHRSKSAYLETT